MSSKHQKVKHIVETDTFKVTIIRQTLQLMMTTCLMTIMMNMETLPMAHQQLKEIQMISSLYKHLH